MQHMTEIKTIKLSQKRNYVAYLNQETFDQRTRSYVPSYRKEQGKDQNKSLATQ